MHCDFKIEAGIYLVQNEHRLDLHNFYEFEEYLYSVKTRSLTLKWQRSPRPEVPSEMPQTVTIEFRGVTHFEFRPQDPDVPFSENSCMANFGNWSSQQQAVAIYDDGYFDSDEAIAIDFMSNATIILRADTATAVLTSKL